MSQKSDGGPVFPVLERSYVDRDDHTRYQTTGGMSLRDYFAAHAPIDFATAASAWGDRNVTLSDDGTRTPFFAVWAMLRYEWADAMIAAREAR